MGRNESGLDEETQDSDTDRAMNVRYASHFASPQCPAESNLLIQVARQVSVHVYLTLLCLFKCPLHLVSDEESMSLSRADSVFQVQSTEPSSELRLYTELQFHGIAPPASARLSNRIGLISSNMIRFRLIVDETLLHRARSLTLMARRALASCGNEILRSKYVS